MSTIPQRIASAFAVLCGRYGDVAQMARPREQSRQALYREAEQVVDAIDGVSVQGRFDDLQRQLTEQRAEVQALLRADNASLTLEGPSSATASPPRMSAGTDTCDAGWCRFEPARPVGSIAGQWRPRPVVGQHSARFPTHSSGFPRSHR